jgi:pimeloyl-ACP methyl ester carboxylesterase
VAYASHEGYPTFAFDRLGNGNSSHPDPITVVQCPAQAEIVHELAKIARAGGGGFPRPFKKIVFVGGSLGSIIGNILNINHPDDVDATILGGFSREWLPAVPGFIATARLLPANSLPVGYLQATSRTGVAYLLFFGPGVFYDTAFINRDYDNRGTVTVGEGASGAVGIGVAPYYRKPVLVISGEQDVLFCGTTALDGKPGNCRSGILEKTRALYPAGDYSWFVVPNAGHCWHHQYSAFEGFKYSHDWLASRGF